MKKSALVILLAASLVLVQPAAQAAKKLKVVASLPSLKSITESIGGAHVEVESITKGSQDAHFVEPKPSYMVGLSKADLLVYSGMELEIGWLPRLIEGARNNNVAVGGRGHLNASAALSESDILDKPRGEIDRTMGDVHPLGNPHYLFNPYNAIKVGELIRVKLAELDPDNSADYQANFDAFKTGLEAKIIDWEGRAKTLSGLKVVCYHPHWSYLLGWLNLEPAGYIELRPGIPPTPQHKMQIINTVKEKGVKLVIVSSWKDPSKAREVAEQGGVPLVILPGEVGALPGTDNYEAWIEYIVDKLANVI